MAHKISVIALLKITSLNSDGRAKIVQCAARYLVGRDHMTNPAFSKFAVGELVVARVGYNFESKRRTLRSVVQSWPGDQKEFETKFAAEIAAQMEQAVLISRSLYPVEKIEVDPRVEVTETDFVEADANWQDKFYVQPEELNAFNMAKKLSAGRIPSKVMIIGPSGYGKTSLPQVFANKNGMNYCRFNVALVRDPEEFFGWRTVIDGDVKFMESEFTKSIRNGNAVVVLDELNRATPEMANALFPILDDAARTTVFGEEIVVGPNVIIVATINQGYQFVGTFALDQALVNRMDFTLRVMPLPRAVEVEVLKNRTNILEPEAEIIVCICNRLRDLNNDGKIVVDASTRTSIRVARFVSNGASFQDAFAWALVNSCDVEERKEVIDVIQAVLP